MIDILDTTYIVIYSENRGCVQLFASLRTVPCQAPLSMGLSRQEQWSYSLLQGIFLTQGWNPVLLPLQADSLPSEPARKPNRNSLFSVMAISLSILSTEVAHKGNILSKPNHLKTCFYCCHSVKHIILISPKEKKKCQMHIRSTILVFLRFLKAVGFCI